MMTPLETAILRTVLYADVFNFPLTTAEIHHFLIHDTPVSLEQVEKTLAHSQLLQQHLTHQAPYIAIRDEIIAERHRREQAAQYLWPLAVRYGAWLGYLPFVRMVALTGALAMRNAPGSDDDLDYMIVTTPNRVWLARAFAIVLVRLVRLRGVVICPNYVLAADSLEQTQQDLFIAHEITQMVPLYGHEHYWHLREANRWTAACLPNAQTPFYHVEDRETNSVQQKLKAIIERALAGRLGNWVERWEYRRKLARFSREMQTPNSAAAIDQSRVKGHFNDYGHPALQRYHERLRQYHISQSGN